MYSEDNQFLLMNKKSCTLKVSFLQFFPESDKYKNLNEAELNSKYMGNSSGHFLLNYFFYLRD